MTKRIMPLLIFLTIGLSLGGCTSATTKWDHPSATQDQWSIDKSGCRSRARRLTEKEYAATEYSRINQNDEFIGGYRSNMRTYDSSRRRQEIYESCLMRLGYTPAKSGN